MIIQFVRFLVRKGNSFLQARNVSTEELLYTPKEWETQKEMVKTEMELNRAQADVYNLRMNIIMAYDMFVVKVQDVYLTLLAKSDDPAIQTTMTQHWKETYELINGMYYQHKELMQKLAQAADAYDRIRQVNNQN